MRVRQIIHVDMDAFFASIEQRDNPKWREQPVIVGQKHRGVVSAASYEARRFGVRSAMSIQSALKKCPTAIIATPRHRVYQKVSRDIFAVFHRYTPMVEGLSLDEAFLDVTNSQKLFGSAIVIARRIQRDILMTTGLTCSAGIGPSKFIAKLASDLQKPNGFVVVNPDHVDAFLAPLPVGKIWGVGSVGEKRLLNAGFKTMGQIAQCAPEYVQATLGDWGLEIAKLSRGEDARPVVAHREAKSLGSEKTFDEDVADRHALRPFLLNQSMDIAGRLHDIKCSAQSVQLKIKYANFHTETRQHALQHPASDPDTFYQAACMLLARLEHRGQSIRLVGLRVFDLIRGGPPRLLFPHPKVQAQEKLELVRMAINTRFGPASLTRASLLHTGMNDDMGE